SSVRVITTSRSAMLSVCILFLLSLEFFEVIIQLIKSLFPKTPVWFEVICNLLQGLCFELAWPPLRLTALRNEPGALQYLEVLGDGGRTHFEGLGQLLDGRFAGGKTCKDGAPGRVSKCREGG